MRLTPALVVFTLALSLACGRPGKEGDGGGLFGDDTGDDGTDLPTLADVPNAGDYDPRRGSVRTWLLMRARSRAIDRLRSARVRRERVTNEQPERVSPSPAPDANLDGARLRVRLGGLPDAPRAVLDGPIGQEMLGKFDAKGFKALAWGENGYREISNSKHAITQPADLKGLKLRVVGYPFVAAVLMTAGVLACGSRTRKPRPRPN